MALARYQLCSICLCFHTCVCVRLQVIYIAPLKALVRERMTDWGRGLCRKLNKRIVELTGGQNTVWSVCEYCTVE